MFSQWKQAVESFAQHAPRSSLDFTSSAAGEDQSRSSLDLGLRSSTHLAESALTNLRKSLGSQRAESPGPGRNSSTEPITGRQPTHRTTLEDRLRAKLVSGESSHSSSSSSPSPSPSPSSPVNIPPNSHAGSARPLSPASTPLPESPLPHNANASDPLAGLSPTSSLSLGQSWNSRKHMSSASITDKPNVSLPPGSGEPRSPTSIPLPDSPSLLPTDEPLSFSDTRPVSLIDKPDPTIGEKVMCDTVETAAEPLADAQGSDPQAGNAIDTSIVPAVPPDNEAAPSEITADGTEQDNTDDHDIAACDNAAKSEGTETPSELTAQPNTHSDQSISLVENPEDERQSVQLLGQEPTASTPARSKISESDVEGLQQRLKQVEQRFADVSTSFKRLQAERIAADKVLRENTPLESIQEVDALRDYLQNMNFKTEMAQDEIRRLTGKLTRQEERIEELRDIHHLESKSQSDQIEKLQGQVDEAEALLKASQSSIADLEKNLEKQEAESTRLQADVERLKEVAKEEEEKRVKAVALLKTVRQKLVKAEKEREDVSKEILTMKEKEQEEREKDKAEKLELQHEIEKIAAEKETAMAGLKAHFDRELTVLKERQEKELLAMKGQFELELLTTKTSLQREIENKNSRISDLESLVLSLEGEKDEFFDQLQMRQAELESSRSRLESLEGQATEYQYQLREASDRIALLTEELGDVHRQQEARVPSVGPSPEEVTRLLSAAESRYETRIGELRKRLSTLERERDEGEAEWSRKLSEKVQELEFLKAAVNSSTKSREEESGVADTLRKEIETLKEQIAQQQKNIITLRTQADKAIEVENAAKAQAMELNAKAVALQQLIEEGKTREAQLRTNNKTLREELRKVQSSAALLERQRNPGVGYWASRQDSSSEARSPRSSVSDLTTRDGPQRPDSPTTRSDEEVNIEYLRNVILQFLEHKEMRPHLVKILSTILCFTPQETRRLISKV